MAEERVQRRLAAILAADVVGYSRLMGSDEAGTLARVPPVDYRDKPPTPSGPILRRQLAPFCSAVDTFPQRNRLST